MTTYIIGTLMSILICIIIKKIWGFRTKKVFKMFISILPLTLISAFRYDVGWDYLPIYTNGFYMVGKYHVDWFTEPLFRFIIKVIYEIYADPMYLFILMSFLYSLFFSICYSVFGEEDKPEIYILLLVLTRHYFNSLNIARQAIASMIALYSLKYINDKKTIKYFIFIILASQIHMSAIIYLPLYFILSKDISKKKNLFLLILLSPVLLMLAIFFIKNTKYVKYFTTMFGNDGALAYSEVFIALTILLICIPVYHVIKKDKVKTIFFNLQLITFIVSLFSIFLPNADRTIWFFSINNIFFIPSLLSCYHDKKLKLIATMVIYLFLSIVFVNQNVLTDSNSIKPYHNILEYRAR